MPDDAIVAPNPEDRDNTRDLTTADDDTMLEVVEFDVIGDGRMFERSIEIDNRAFLVSALFGGSIAESSVNINDAMLLPDDKTFFIDRAETADTGVIYTKIEPVGDGERCRLVFRGFLEAGSQAKVYVLVLFRRIRQWWKDLSCDECKKFIGVLLSLIFLSLGVADISMLDIIPTELWDLVDPDNLPDAVTRILENIDPDLMGRFRDALNQVGQLVEGAQMPKQIIVERICELLRFCP